MFKSKVKIMQLAVTLLACAFLFVPIIMSVLAGLTANYFKGISSGLTFKWVIEVWELYANSIFLSMWLAIACLVCTLIIGLPAAYGLGPPPWMVVAAAGGIHLVATCDPRFGARLGVVATLWFDERVPCILDIYTCRARTVHITFHGKVHSCGPGLY